jgi:hypothetical protein
MYRIQTDLPNVPIDNPYLPLGIKLFVCLQSADNHRIPITRLCSSVTGKNGASLRFEIFLRGVSRDGTLHVSRQEYTEKLLSMWDHVHRTIFNLSIGIRLYISNKRHQYSYHWHLYYLWHKHPTKEALSMWLVLKDSEWSDVWNIKTQKLWCHLCWLLSGPPTVVSVQNWLWLVASLCLFSRTSKKG